MDKQIVALLAVMEMALLKVGWVGEIDLMLDLVLLNMPLLWIPKHEVVYAELDVLNVLDGLNILNILVLNTLNLQYIQDVLEVALLNCQRMVGERIVILKIF